jgi:hypothetical protein
MKGATCAKSARDLSETEPIRVKGDEMPGNNQKMNPASLIAIGVCFMGAGVALSAALHSRGASGVGIGIIGVGVMFLLIGAAKKRKVGSGKSEGDEDNGPRA